MTHIGFDDHATKLEYYEEKHLGHILDMALKIRQHGKDSIEAQKAKIEQWHVYLQCKTILIEQHIDNDLLRMQCLAYIQSLSSTYSIDKAKLVLDGFMKIVQRPRNWISLQVYMQRNPIS